MRYLNPLTGNGAVGIDESGIIHLKKEQQPDSPSVTINLWTLLDRILSIGPNDILVSEHFNWGIFRKGNVLIFAFIPNKTKETPDYELPAKIEIPYTEFERARYS